MNNGGGLSGKFYKIADRIKHLSLKRIDYNNQEQMSDVIETLGYLEKELTYLKWEGILQQDIEQNKEMSGSEDAIEKLIEIYSHSLEILRVNEGKDLHLCEISVKLCFRLIPLFLAYIHDYYCFFDSEIIIPEEIKEMM